MQESFRNFEEMIVAFERNEWGNGDCLKHLSRLTGKVIVVLTEGGSPNYFRWRTLRQPQGMLFMWNSRSAVNGSLVHFDPLYQTGELCDELQAWELDAYDVADVAKALV